MKNENKFLNSIKVKKLIDKAKMKQKDVLIEIWKRKIVIARSTFCEAVNGTYPIRPEIVQALCEILGTDEDITKKY